VEKKNTAGMQDRKQGVVQAKIRKAGPWGKTTAEDSGTVGKSAEAEARPNDTKQSGRRLHLKRKMKGSVTKSPKNFWSVRRGKCRGVKEGEPQLKKGTKLYKLLKRGVRAAKGENNSLRHPKKKVRGGEI